jgi:hypothetical protein
MFEDVRECRVPGLGSSDPKSRSIPFSALDIDIGDFFSCIFIFGLVLNNCFYFAQPVLSPNPLPYFLASPRPPWIRPLTSLTRRKPSISPTSASS